MFIDLKTWYLMVIYITYQVIYIMKILLLLINHYNWRIKHSCNIYLCYCIKRAVSIPQYTVYNSLSVLFYIKKIGENCLERRNLLFLLYFYIYCWYFNILSFYFNVFNFTFSFKIKLFIHEGKWFMKFMCLIA